MTVVDAQGNAVCFPKPLTISSHTLRAVHADDLTPKEWRRLQFQSRLHSKGGRSIALRLARFNLPIMGINAITQIMVPPPKYTVDRLVPCRLGSATRVRELFVIQRGAPRLADIDHTDAVEQMLANTEDAYGFPPYRYLAPAITVDGLDHAQLKAREREILEGFLSNVRVRALASDNFGWADEIPRLLRQEHGTGQAAGQSGTGGSHVHGVDAQDTDAQDADAQDADTQGAGAQSGTGRDAAGGAPRPEQTPVSAWPRWGSVGSGPLGALPGVAARIATPPRNPRGGLG
jgi:hypothetical protein